MNTKSTPSIEVFYLTLPFILFALTFLKLYIGLPVALLALYCWLRTPNNETYNGTISAKNKSILFLFALALCFFCGVGSFFSQHGDFFVKNPLLRDLCTQPWPLKIDLSAEPQEVQDSIGSDKVAFIYYLFFYLPAGAIGQVFGELAGRIAFLLWSAWGLYLVLKNLALFILANIHASSKRIIGLLLLFLAFAGLDTIAKPIRYPDISIEQNLLRTVLDWNEIWCLPYFPGYHGLVFGFYTSFNQNIPCWLITLLIAMRKDNTRLFFYYALMMLYSPWASIGMLPMVLYLWIRDNKGLLIRKRDFITTFNVPNVAFPLILLIIVGSYYASNPNATRVRGWFTDFMTVKEFWTYYPALILTELAVYFWVLRHQLKQSPILCVSFVILMLLPFYHITPANDLLMRGALPALFIVFISWSKWVFEHFSQYRYWIIAFCFITSFSCWQVVVPTLHTIAVKGHLKILDSIHSYYSIQKNDFSGMIDTQFFAHNYQETFFWKYIGK